MHKKISIFRGNDAKRPFPYDPFSSCKFTPLKIKNIQWSGIGNNLLFPLRHISTKKVRRIHGGHVPYFFRFHNDLQGGWPFIVGHRF